MQESARDVVFTIPELMALIAQYLSPRDTSQWMMTCKAFSRQLEPLFWSHPVIMRTTRDPSSLVRHTHHFRSLIIEHDLWLSFIKDAPPSPLRTTSHGPSALQGFPRLEKLTVHGHRPNVSLTSNFVPTLRQSPHLTDLSIQYPFRQDPLFMELIVASLATELPCLQRLLIEIERADPAIGFQLLDVCFRHLQLIDLRCDLVMCDDQSLPSGVYSPRFAALLKTIQDMDKIKEEAGQPTGLRLRSLSLPFMDEGYPKDFLIPLLKWHVPNLERLLIVDVHMPDGEGDIQWLKEAIAACPRLQHLSGNWLYWGNEYETTVDTVICSCAGAGLKSFRFECFSGDDTLIWNLLKYHANTLEDIDFQACHGLTSESIISIVTTCTNLRRLRVEPYDLNGWTTLGFGHVLTEWICRDITVLHLCLRREVVVPEGRTEDGVVAEAAQRVYSQIGRLVKLEDLTLGCVEKYRSRGENSASDLTLEHGWLAALAGLKRLRLFQMSTDFWSRMGQAEVEFMDANWPRLESVSFGFSNLKEQMLREDHWKWLKEKRPQLDFSSIIPTFS
ncbi:MAG: hypothetical protein J3Q66DRAFT_330722 [Benniella sp.]|nr:MAG: hypothetical protein J3Q66DRAFT_330722 [Benniella sp.]